uniref:Tudor domain-containing protein n=1 Tax=Timema douglasi TaxID=61478 RepID=A0A7R8VYX8_TIMDO|nr:unnamed protein product [Timema douglasi]
MPQHITYPQVFHSANPILYETRWCSARSAGIRIPSLEEGQIVAAPFLYDNKWYRAEVAKVTLDDYNIEDSKVSLYYVDYGDSATRSKHEVCELRTDFLRLRFQAIECCLARVKPRARGTWEGRGPFTRERVNHKFFQRYWGMLLTKHE